VRIKGEIVGKRDNVHESKIPKRASRQEERGPVGDNVSTRNLDSTRGGGRRDSNYRYRTRKRRIIAVVVRERKRPTIVKSKITKRMCDL